jgi:long-chain acyl-CoA synthetase
VKYLALGLLAVGFQPGSKLLIVGDNRPEWYFAQMAAHCDRGLSVGLYSDLSAAEIEYIAGDSGADFAMVEDQEQVDKMALIRDRLPELKAVVYWRYKGLSNQTGDGFMSLRAVLDRGRQYEADHPIVFEENISAGCGDDVCAIIYTSGVTKDPKATLHSYRSLMADSQAFVTAERLTAKDNLVSYLPPAWITEQWLAFGCHLLSGGTVNFAESSETQREDVREIAPSLVVYNSRLWESEAGEVLAKMRGAGWLKRLFTRWSLPIGYRVTDSRYSGKNPSLYSRVLNGVANLIAFRPIRDSLGLPHARACYTSGATLSPEALRFLHAVGVPVRDVYGSAEAGAVTGAFTGMQSPGTVGRVNPGVEIKIAETGEIAVKHGGTFLGYRQSAETERTAASNGWVHTGDKGEVTPDGELVFVDRMEDLITLPCGEVVGPQEIESRLKYSPYIKDAWVHAEQGCESLSAVIIIDAANTGHWADKRKVVYTTFGDLSQQPQIYELIRGEIARVNQGLPEARRISRYVNLHKEFDPDEHELTRNRKLRRSFLRERYAGLARALSGEDTSVEVEAEFTYQDGRTGKVKTALQIATLGQGES